MAVFISTSVDSFEEVRRAQKYNTVASVRRPIKGIELKDESFAYLRVVRSDGEVVFMIDGGARPEDVHGDIGVGRGTTSFLLQAVSEQRVEKSQIVETFGEDFIFLFGERPRMVTFSGVLLNTKDFNWKNEFLHNYEMYFRGTRTLEMDARVYLTFDDVMCEGYVLSTSVDMNSDNRNLAQFSFQMFVTAYSFLRNPGTAVIPGYGTDLPPDNLDQVITDRKIVYADRDEFVTPGDIGWHYGETPDYTSPWGAAVDNAVGIIQDNIGAALVMLSELTEMGVDASAPLYQAILMGPNAYRGVPAPDQTGVMQLKGDIATIHHNWGLEPPPPHEILPALPELPVVAPVI